MPVTPPPEPRANIPVRGEPHADILAAMQASRAEEADYRGGKTWSLVYWAGDAHHHLIEQAHAAFLAENALNPMAFKSLKRMEAEVVEMTAGMLHAPLDACGTMTSGGTESLLLAVKTYRDRARKRKPWILRPNIVVPETIHVAFDKAAHLFDVKKKVAPVDDNGAVIPKAMARLCDAQTIMLAASAPQYVHGTVDPIPEIAAIALRKKLPMHVDGCFGGFILPWLEKIGVQMPVWDFRVPGVTSVSADVHKYGFGAKGASVIVYRDMSYLRHQFFVATQWSGGIYVSPGLPGTRPGGPIAAAWAAMHALGEDGYIALAKGAWETAEFLRRGIEAIPGLRVMGLPHSTAVTWTSDDRTPGKNGVDVYAVADILQAKGWGVDRQQKPASVHLTVNANNRQVAELYLSDLRAAVEHVRAHPELATQGEAAVYGLMSKVPIGRLVDREVLKVVEGMYSGGGARTPAGASGGGEPGFVERNQARIRPILDKWDDARKKLQSLRRRGGR